MPQLPCRHHNIFPAHFTNRIAACCVLYNIWVTRVQPCYEATPVSTSSGWALGHLPASETMFKSLFLVLLEAQGHSHRPRKYTRIQILCDYKITTSWKKNPKTKKDTFQVILHFLNVCTSRKLQVTFPTATRFAAFPGKTTIHSSAEDADAANPGTGLPKHTALADTGWHFTFLSWLDPLSVHLAVSGASPSA